VNYFFAKKVLLVEGATEKTVIPYLAQKLEIFKHEYSVIDCGSINNIPAYCGLLNKFSIPYIALYDQDHQTGKDQSAIDSANIASQAIIDSINTDMGSTIMLINDIEEELNMPAGSAIKPYTALEFISDASFIIPQDLRTKIETLYA